jgi:hypothetical protein
MGTVLAAHVHAAGIAADFAPGRALHHADAALQLAEHAQSTFLLPAEHWLHCARALLAAREQGRAAELLDAGQEWIHRTARENVPEPFRDSFLHRNPVNRELLLLASRTAP